MDKEQTQVTTEKRTEESAAYRFAYDFTTTHKGTREKCLEWLESTDTNSASTTREAVFLYLMANSPDYKIREAAEQYADKWTEQALSGDGITELTEKGWAGEIPLLVRLSDAVKQSEFVLLSRPELDELARKAESQKQSECNNVISFFKQCSPREKFLIRAFMQIGAAMNEHNSDEELQEAVRLDENEIPQDMAFLSAVLDAVNLC